MSRKASGPKPHPFSNKLLLNQWLISLFGIDPLIEHKVGNKKVLPFHKLAEPIKDTNLEGLDNGNQHHFYHHLAKCPLFKWGDPMWEIPGYILSPAQLAVYELNIVHHTQTINATRKQPIVWKYHQWLTLLFSEIYLDKYFSNKEQLLADLNAYVGRFNRHWGEFADVPPYTEEDLNKICLQNATGSGKTLLMHVNLLQYKHYAKKFNKEKELSRVILLTPGERLSAQHITEFAASNFPFVSRLEPQKTGGLGQIDVIEITKLGEQEGPQTIATRSLGDQNLLLVDEGHRGMSGGKADKEEGIWFTRRSDLCEKGFTFEYSATFEQAVSGTNYEDDYAKAILFDYSYRWFYEDGFGKDYQILNIPQTFESVRANYLTACLLKFYQQLRIYQERTKDFAPFNLEKPLWVFVGNTVSAAKTQDEKEVITDVAEIIKFIADFLGNAAAVQDRIKALITSKGRDTGLLDKDGGDIFNGAFFYLAKAMSAGETTELLYKDILARLFHNAAGGKLLLERIKGDSGEIALKVGKAETCFGLINVGDAKGLADYLQGTKIPNVIVEESSFDEAMFASIRESASPVNLLIGSKKFIEGWDCWRVSTMGLMHVGRKEGTQIIQLFGRGVRLKGYNWSLKRSGYSNAKTQPAFIEELEMLNVFGVKSDFMETFRDFLKEQGLPGNEKRKVFLVPLNVTYDFGKNLKVLRPKRKAADGKEYDFKRDAPVPSIGDVPAYLTQNPVESDWYPRISAMQSKGEAIAVQKDQVSFSEEQLALMDYDALYFAVEEYKRDRGWYNINVSKAGIKSLLKRTDWYKLCLPKSRLNPTSYDGIRLLQQVVAELLRGYCEKYYKYRSREYIEPRLELRELTAADENLPQDNFYQLIVDGSEAQLITAIEGISKEIAEKKKDLMEVGDIKACTFSSHLYQPLFHVRKGGKITILPLALGESEYQFVTDLKAWCDKNKGALKEEGKELFLLRNMSRGKGMGFFEAGGFYPDFILWVLNKGKQYITFIEPHGLIHEGPASDKILFYKRIKTVEQRLADPNTILNSFILSWTKYPELKWGPKQADLEAMHVLFMQDDRDKYIDKLFSQLQKGRLIRKT